MLVFYCFTKKKKNPLKFLCFENQPPLKKLLHFFFFSSRSNKNTIYPEKSLKQMWTEDLRVRAENNIQWFFVCVFFEARGHSLMDCLNA